MSHYTEFDCDLTLEIGWDRDALLGVGDQGRKGPTFTMGARLDVADLGTDPHAFERAAVERLRLFADLIEKRISARDRGRGHRVTDRLDDEQADG